MDNGQDGKKRTGVILKTVTVILASVTAFAAVFAALSGSGATAVVSRELTARTASPAPATPVRETEELTDEEALSLGSELDDTGLSLMPQGFIFEDVTGEEQTVEGTGDLVPGVRDAQVIEIKTRLMELSYMEADEPSDFYGDQTAYAVQLFQREHALETTGAADKETLELLFSESASKYVVSVGINGTDVEEIQKRLKELGYLKVKVTGYFGSDTKKAVMAFQKNNGLKDDGSVGDQTREVLYSSSAKKAKSPATKKPSAKATATAAAGGATATAAKGEATATAGGEPAEQDPAATPTEKPASSLPAPNGGAVETFINYASTLMGKPYVLGGKGPDKFDCSGFIYYALNMSGVKKLSYMTSGGWANSSYPTVEKGDLQRGDILCFKGHVGIYLGNGQMLDASSDEGKIRITSNIWSKNYWNKNFRFGKRVLY